MCNNNRPGPAFTANVLRRRFNFFFKISIINFSGVFLTYPCDLIGEQCIFVSDTNHIVYFTQRIVHQQHWKVKLSRPLCDLAHAHNSSKHILLFLRRSYQYFVVFFFVVLFCECYLLLSRWTSVIWRSVFIEQVAGAWNESIACFVGF